MRSSNFKKQLRFSRLTKIKVSNKTVRKPTHTQMSWMKVLRKSWINSQNVLRSRLCHQTKSQCRLGQDWWVNLLVHPSLSMEKTKEENLFQMSLKIGWEKYASAWTLRATLRLTGLLMVEVILQWSRVNWSTVPGSRVWPHRALQRMEWRDRHVQLWLTTRRRDTCLNDCTLIWYAYVR